MAISDPRDISGLVAWYSAEAETGYTDGTQMTSWTDLSGNGNHATAFIGPGGSAKPRWKATEGSASGPAVRFTQSEVGYFSLPNLLNGAAAGEIMATIQSTGVNSGHWAFGPSAGGQDSYYPYAGTVYDAFGLTAGQRRSFVPSLAVTSWRRYNVWSAANDWAARLDETTQLTYASATVGWHSSPKLGMTDQVSSQLQMFDGRMGAVVIYNRKLTTTERADLATWMAAHPSGGTLSVPITVTGEKWATAATMLDGTPKIGLRITGEAWTGAATMLDGTIPVSVPITVTGEPWAATATALNGTGRLRVTGDAWAASATALGGNIVGAPIIATGEPWTAAATALDGFAFTPPPRNGYGLVLDSSATLAADDVLEPEPSVPAGTPSTALHIVAPTVPVPTLVAGRPQ